MKTVQRFLSLVLVTSISFLSMNSTHADVLVSSLATHSVLRFNKSTGAFIDAFVPGQAGDESGPLINPGGLAFGPDRNVYVASRGNSNILQYEWPTGNFLGTFQLGGNLGFIHDIVFGPDGNLYVSSDDRVKEFNGTTGQFLGDFTDTGQSLKYLNYGPDGDLYGSNEDTKTVRRFDGDDGSFLGEFVDTTEGGGFVPGGLAFGPGFGPNGDLYVQSGSGIVRRYDGSTGAFLQDFAFGVNTNSESIAFGPDGHLYVAKTGPMTIERFNGTNGVFIDTFISTDPPDVDISIPYDFVFISGTVGRSPGHHWINNYVDRRHAKTTRWWVYVSAEILRRFVVTTTPSSVG